ncbi:MAG: PEP-CTERM sorting domain-containing protein [Tepidisphaeraceae bacterium]
MRRSSAVLAAVAATAVGNHVCATTAQAQAVAIYATEYIGPDGGDWSNAANWLNPADNTHVGPGPTANVTIANGNKPVYNGGGQVLTLNIQSGLTLNSANIEILGYSAGPGSNFIPGGLITLNGASGFKFDAADTAEKPVYFNAGATIVGTSDSVQIIGNIRNTNSTFRGGGHFGQYPYWVQNGGTFNADTAGLTMAFNPGLLPNAVYLPLGGGGGVYSGLSNVGGTITATNGGRVLLGGGGGGFDNSGGTLSAIGAGSVISLANNAVLSGGTLNCADGGTFRVDTAQTGYVDAVFNASTRMLVADQGQLLIAPYNFTNNGVITVGTSTTTALTILQCATGYGYGPSQTYNGTGTVVLASDFAEIACAGGTLTNGAGHTIRGFGKIQNGGYSFTNDGTLIADQAGKQLGTLRLVNNGSIQAINGGIFARNGYDTDQTGGGSMTATGAGSEIRLVSGNVVTGGTLNGLSGGIVRIGDPTTAGADAPGIQSLTLNGTARVSPGKQLRIGGSVINNASITLEPNRSGQNTTSVALASNAVLAGTGEIVLTDDGVGSSRVSTADYNYGPNTQLAGHTIRGAGNMTTFDFDNQGTIRADTAGKTLSVAGASNTVISLVNNGLFEATNGGTLQLYGKYTNGTGTVRANGGTVYGSTLPTNFSGTTLTGGTWDARASTIRIDGMTVVTNNAALILDGAAAKFASDAAGTNALATLAANPGSLTLRNGANLSTGPLTNPGVITVGAGSALTVAGTLTNTGTLAGAGTITATSVNAGGTLAPGASPGTLTIDGNLAVANGSAYDWEVSSSANDLIDVNGTLTFGATAILNVSLYGSTEPSPGDYALFTFDGSTPMLPAWTINLPDGWASGGVHASGQTIYLTLTGTPEPASLGLLAFAGAALLGRRRSSLSAV